MQINKQQEKLKKALTLHQSGSMKEAESAYLNILSDNTSELKEDALYLLSNLYYQTDDIDRSIVILRKLLSLYADNTNAIKLYAQLLLEKKQYEQALECFLRTERDMDDDKDILAGLARCYIELGMLNDACDKYLQLLKLSPDSWETLYNLGLISQRKKLLSDAEEYYKSALQYNITSFELYNNLGEVQQDQAKLLDAQKSYKNGLELNPDSVEINNNLGTLFHEAGEYDNAIGCYKHALYIKPDFADAHLNLSLCYLLLGDYNQGWKEYEWRWKVSDVNQYKLDVPQWQGEDLSGKTILIYSEQGFGDTFQFLRYIKLLKKQNAKVIFHTRAELHTISAWCDAIDIIQVVDSSNHVCTADYMCALMSLPLYFHTEATSIPVGIPYISSKDNISRESMIDLSPDSCNVGIAWGGQEKFEHDYYRNPACPLRYFEPLVNLSGFSFVSLQKGDAHKQLDTVKFRNKVIDTDKYIDDFVDTGLILDKLDLVITIDTSIAHLAGAMGKVVWLLLPVAPDWRWMLSRNDSPWYPGMKIFRQKKPGDWQGVIAEVCKALKTYPVAVRDTDSLLVRGANYFSQGQYTKAEEVYRLCLDLMPGHFDALNNLAIALKNQGKLIPAIEFIEQAIRINPDVAASYNNLGNIRKLQHDLKEAKLCYEKSLAIKPDDYEVMNNLGNTLQAMNDVSSAVGYFRRAIEIRPDFAQAHFNYAIACLLSGDYINGWREYEWGFVTGQRSVPDMKMRKWEGQSLENMHLLIIAEQGVGDTIQFLRFLPELKSQGAVITLQCAMSLERLLSHHYFIDNVIPSSDAYAGDADYYIPMMSLPAVLDIELNGIPASIPYMMTEITALRAWKKKLGNVGKFKAGIVWAGNPEHENDTNRSCLLQDFSNILNISNIAFYSLQIGKASQQIDMTMSSKLHNLENEINDYADTAAIVSLMDIIITVDTSVAHLAGALGKPVFLLLPFAPDWRWLLNRQDSPWYPTIKIFRQDKPCNWEAVFNIVKVELEALLSPQSPSDLMQLADDAITSNRFSDAAECYKKVLLSEKNEIACNNLGKIYLLQSDTTSAKSCYMQALDIKPDYVEAYNGLAATFMQEGSISASLRNLNKALELEPGHALAHYNRGFIHLLQGDYIQGWKDYEYRLVLPGRDIQARIPRWNGEPVSNKIIRVIAEQGIGDTFQFVRFLPLVKEKCLKVVLVCQSGLVSILNTVDGADTVTDDLNETDSDMYVPLMSLPGLFNIRLETIPVTIPYIYADGMRDKWKKRVSNIEGFKAGIVWTGNPDNAENARRSCTIDDFLSLTDIRGLQLICLQKGVAQEQLDMHLNTPGIFDFSSEIVSWNDTAEIILQLDLVITVCTSVAHLAGALGKPVWLLLHYTADWRWLQKRNDSPWYPDARLFRQSSQGDWGSVFDKVRSSLASLMAPVSDKKPLYVLPENVTVEKLSTTGLEFIKQGELDKADYCFSQALKKSPDNKEVILYQASLKLQKGELTSAGELTDYLRNVDSGNPFVFNLSGLVYMELGSNGVAEIFMKQAIQMRPDEYNFHDNLATIYTNEWRNDDARTVYKKCIELAPQNPNPYYNIARLYERDKNWDDAIKSYRKALNLKSDFIEAINNLAGLLQKRGDYESAIKLYKQCIDSVGENPDILNNLATAYQGHMDLPLARQYYKKVIKLKPDYADAYLNLGTVEQLDSNLDLAIEYFDKSIQLMPDNPVAYNNMGAAQQRVGNLTRAVLNFQKSVLLHPDYADGHFNLSLCNLLLGHYSRGWQEYEWRLKRTVSGVRSVTGARWTGEPLDGKRILVYAEQGYGDTFQFIRFLPQVKERGGYVIFESQLGLGSILENCEGIDELVDWLDAGDKELEYDISIPLMSLPYILDITLDNLPAAMPYIKINQQPEKWNGIMEPANLNVGIVWAGRPTHQNDKNRSCILDDFASISMIEGVKVYSLQKGSAISQLEQSDLDIVNLDSAIDSFSDTAGIISTLDLVITVDTSVAHLAGAMGAKVWLVIPFAPDWRWLQHRTDSPWYPTARIYRQEKTGQWDDVFIRVKNDLVNLVCSRDINT